MANEPRSSRSAWRAGALTLALAAVLSATPAAAGAATPGTTTSQAPTTHAAKRAAIATVTNVVGDVKVELAGTTTYVPVTGDTVLHIGDSISTDVDAQATVHVAAGEVTVYELSLVRIDEMFARTDLTRLQVLLRFGRVEAAIPARTLIRSDFTVQTPVAVTSIRGGAMIVTVTKGGITTVHTTHDQAFVKGTADAAPLTVPEGQVSTVGIDGLASAPVVFFVSTPGLPSTSDAPAQASAALVWILIALVAMAIAGAVVVTTRGRVRLR